MNQHQLNIILQKTQGLVENSYRKNAFSFEWDGAMWWLTRASKLVLKAGYPTESEWILAMSEIIQERNTLENQFVC